MKTKQRLFFTFCLLLLSSFTLCHGKEYQKIQLKENFASVEEKANWAVWRTDYYICTEIAYAKSIGKTPFDFSVFVGNHHSWEGIKGQDLKPAVQVLYGPIKLYENSTFQITSESDTLR